MRPLGRQRQQRETFLMTRTKRHPAWLFLSLLLAGCSSSPGNPLGIFPEGQRLLPDTKLARKVNAEAQPLPRELDKMPAEPYVVEPGDVLFIQLADFDLLIRIPGDQPIFFDGSIYF